MILFSIPREEWVLQRGRTCHNLLIRNFFCLNSFAWTLWGVNANTKGIQSAGNFTQLLYMFLHYHNSFSLPFHTSGKKASREKMTAIYANAAPGTSVGSYTHRMWCVCVCVCVCGGVKVFPWKTHETRITVVRDSEDSFATKVSSRINNLGLVNCRKKGVNGQNFSFIQNWNIYPSMEFTRDA